MHVVQPGEYEGSCKQLTVFSLTAAIVNFIMACKQKKWIFCDKAQGRDEKTTLLYDVSALSSAWRMMTLPS